MNAYQKTLNRMESEVKRAKAQVELLKMLHREMLEQQKKVQVKG